MNASQASYWDVQPKVAVFNTTDETVPPFAAMRIADNFDRGSSTSPSFDLVEGAIRWNIIKPNAASQYTQLPAAHIFNGPDPIRPNRCGAGTRALPALAIVEDMTTLSDAFSLDGEAVDVWSIRPVGFRAGSWYLHGGEYALVVTGNRGIDLAERQIYLPSSEVDSGRQLYSVALPNFARARAMLFVFTEFEDADNNWWLTPSETAPSMTRGPFEIDESLEIIPAVGLKFKSSGAYRVSVTGNLKPDPSETDAGDVWLYLQGGRDDGEGNIEELSYFLEQRVGWDGLSSGDQTLTYGYRTVSFCGHIEVEKDDALAVRMVKTPTDLDLDFANSSLRMTIEAI